MGEPPSSPPNDLTSPQDALVYYKAQYEQLEQELAEFQASSQELEAELEKDVEEAEKRERALKEKAEGLGFEVEEWKTKYKQAKSEANTAQNTLQKEITTLRDANRTLQLKLRDIEVANDDFERQARNTSSSLEDLESKFNVAIERGVMMEEEIKLGEQERENLRIEVQRLRDELSDLKIEAEIMQDKLRKQNARPFPTISTNITAPNSPSLEGSPDSAASSPMITTPPDTKSVSTADTVSDTPTPPSPPISEASGKVPNCSIKTPMNPPSKIRPPAGESSITPKPQRHPPTRSVRTSKAPTVPVNSARATPVTDRTSKRLGTKGAPNSNSLSHIRTLTAQMQRLEQRVQSARSKLPGPVDTPPGISPRLGATPSNSYVPPSVTIRSRKRTGGSTVSAASSIAEDTHESSKVNRTSTSGISRLSFGRTSERKGQDNTESSRPSSRASIGFTRPERPMSRTDLGRPASRTSMSGVRTPLGHFSHSSTTEARRPRSSIGGNTGSHVHGHSQSVSQIDVDEYRELNLSTPCRRSTFSKQELDGSSAIPLPSGITRRQSGNIPMTPSTRRTSTGLSKEPEKRGDTSMKPPGRTRKLADVGETY